MTKEQVSAPVYNQFTRPRTPELLDVILTMHSSAPAVRKLYDEIQANPNMCHVPKGGNSLWFKYEGQRRRIAIRAIVYYLHKGTTPIFSACTCGNKGCVNPEHQQEQSSFEVDVMSPKEAV